MAELSRDEVVGVLGRLSDVIIAEIIATGITKDELAAGLPSGVGPGAHRDLDKC